MEPKSAGGVCGIPVQGQASVGGCPPARVGATCGGELARLVVLGGHSGPEDELSRGPFGVLSHYVDYAAEGDSVTAVASGA